MTFEVGKTYKDSEDAEITLISQMPDGTFIGEDTDSGDMFKINAAGKYTFGCSDYHLIDPDAPKLVADGEVVYGNVFKTSYGNKPYSKIAYIYDSPEAARSHARRNENTIAIAQRIVLT